jgi:predicted DsbA family dithiol-disulfide isomerase
VTDKTVFSQFAAQLNMNTAAFDQCLNSGRYKTEVQKDFFDGKLAGVDGTPTFFLNGYKLEGAYSEQFWREALDYLLSKQ